MMITDADVEKLTRVTPEKRLALVLYWLFIADILDDDGYAQAVALATLEPVVDDVGGPSC